MVFRKAAHIFLLIFTSLRVFGLEIGDTFVLKEGNYVPLFTTNEEKLRYDAGIHGTNCYTLDTVLLPGTFVKVEKVSKESSIVGVFCKVSEKCLFKGFVHKSFIESMMDSMDVEVFESSSPSRDILEVSDICALLINLASNDVEYGLGCNNLQEIDLPSDYSYELVENMSEEKDPKYRCVGFDCSGLLHFISSGVLPHSTKELYNWSDATCINTISLESTEAELAEVLSSLSDTDYIVYIHPYVVGSGTGHAVISVHGGFVEASGVDRGIVYTDATSALNRLRALIDTAKSSGAKDLRVFRWYPETK